MMVSPARVWFGLWLSFLCATLQAGGVHVHLCLDGFEPQQSLHWGDADLRDAQRHGIASHHDRDVCVQPPALTGTSHLPALLGAAALLVWASALALPLAKLLPSLAHRCVVLSRRFYRLLPPAQAPPR